MPKHCTILAMDLSLSSPAFAVLDILDGKPTILHLSHVKTNAKQCHGSRLHDIAVAIEDIFNSYAITEVVREKGFSRFAMATQTLFKVVGISDIIAFNNDHYKVFEISPTTIKKEIAGTGKAKKEDVEKGLEKYFPGMIYKNDDESDAVGVGITHALQRGYI